MVSSAREVSHACLLDGDDGIDRLLDARLGLTQLPAATGSLAGLGPADEAEYGILSNRAQRRVSLEAIRDSDRSSLSPLPTRCCFFGVP